jgi:cell division protein FtsN
MPASNDRGRYIVQVGSFVNRRGADQVFRTLTNAGLRPAYERFGRYNRVVIPNVPVGDIPFLARHLGAMGFKEIWIRK